MSEPSHAGPITSTPSKDELTTLLGHQFPGAIVDKIDGAYVVLTVHGVGNSEREAIENALRDYKNMKADGESLPQMLADVQADLRENPGMSRKRHDSLMDLLCLCDNALNRGILTHTVPWINVMGYTREIDDLKRRVAVRLSMIAQAMKDREDSKKRASQTSTRTQTRPKPDVSGMTGYERLLAGI